MNTQLKYNVYTNEKGISFKIPVEHSNNFRFVRNHIINVDRVETIYIWNGDTYCFDWKSLQFNN